MSVLTAKDERIIFAIIFVAAMILGCLLTLGAQWAISDGEPSPDKPLVEAVSSTKDADHACAGSCQSNRSSDREPHRDCGGARSLHPDHLN